MLLLFKNHDLAKMYIYIAHFYTIQHSITCCEPAFLLGVEHQGKGKVRKHLHSLQVTRQIPTGQRQTCGIL